MKKELIKTNNYLLVIDDSEIKVNDWYYLPRTNSAYRCQADPTELEMEKRFGVAKVIAHLPLNDSPILEGVPLLPPLEEGVFVLPTHFEFEMVDFEVDMGLGEKCIEYGQYPKTTTNSQGQVVACGKYIY